MLSRQGARRLSFQTTWIVCWNQGSVKTVEDGSFVRRRTVSCFLLRVERDGSLLGPAVSDTNVVLRNSPTWAGWLAGWLVWKYQ